MFQRLELSPPFDTLWKGKDPIVEAFALTGKVYRELESRRTLRIEVNGKGYFVKLHEGCGWWPILKEWLRLRRPVLGAQTEYDALSLLRFIGVSTMRPVGFGVKGSNPASQRSFLITEELTHTVDLETYCKQWRSAPPKTEHKRALIAAVAQMTQKMHAAGMNHRDLYLVHFLLHQDRAHRLEHPDQRSDAVRNEGDQKNAVQAHSTLRVSLIDLHRAQIRPTLPKRWRNKDLAALAYSSHDIGLSRTDRVRFLTWYFQKSLREVVTEEAPALQFLQSEMERLKRRWNRRFDTGTMARVGYNPSLWIDPKSEAFLKECGLDRYTLFYKLWNHETDLIEPANTSQGGFSVVAKITLGPPENAQHFFLKRQENQFFYSLRYPFGAPMLFRELINLLGRRSKGFPSVRPIAYGARNIEGTKRALLLTTDQTEGLNGSNQFTLKSGNQLTLKTHLRILPNKRITAIAIYQNVEVIAKIFLGRDWLKKQTREQNGLNLLRMAGLACPEIIAVEPLADDQGGVMIIRKIQNITPLSSLLTKTLDITSLRLWIKCLLGLHRAELVHGDPHLDNFLLDTQGQLWIIDGDRVKKTDTPNEKIDNLALALAQIPAGLNFKLNHWLDKEEIASHYGENVDLAQRRETAYNLRMAELMKKLRRDSSLCSIRETLFERLASEPSFLSTAERIAAERDNWIESSDILKAGNSATLGRIRVENRDLVIKRYNIKSIGHWLRRIGKTGRAWHSWEMSHVLQFCGVPTAQSLAVIERRCGPFRGRSWLIMESIHGAPLSSMYPENAEVFDNTMQAAIVTLFERLIASRIYQGDMKASNLLWSDGRLIMVDLDACVRKSSPTTFRPWLEKMVRRFANNWPSYSSNHIWCMTRLMHLEQITS